MLPNLASAYVSLLTKARGPSHAVSTACATGANAVGDAYSFIKALAVSPTFIHV